ncbi:MAG: hypothetical protein UIC65_04855, partial [Alphaproteobacteria bacterium]|nr:hypothetical protein [Alphaproteobacteria bacterium]
MSKAKKQVEVIDMGGAKTVAKKKSFVTITKRTFALITLVWFVLLVWFPLHVKNTYSQPIKKSIVVSMFFDLQKGIVKQYEALLDSVAGAINLEKPISIAIDKVKLAEKGVDKVTDTTASAKEKTAAVSEKTSGVKKLTGLANKFGVKTDGVVKAVANVINVGDYYYSDGTTSSEIVAGKTVVGIVISRDNAKSTDVRLPEGCTHGLVLALGQGEGNWSSSYDAGKVNTWALANGYQNTTGTYYYSGSYVTNDYGKRLLG